MWSTQMATVIWIYIFSTLKQSPFWFLTRPIVENLYDDQGRMLSDKVGIGFLFLLLSPSGDLEAELVRDIQPSNPQHLFRFERSKLL